MRWIPTHNLGHGGAPLYEEESVRPGIQVLGYIDELLLKLYS